MISEELKILKVDIKVKNDSFSSLRSNQKKSEPENIIIF